MVQRVAEKAAKRGLSMRVAGEVRFIKDRGGDHNEWGWNPPGASAREIDPDYEFNAKNLEPLVRVLRSTLMALGHLQTARTVFTKIKGQRVSPDGNIGGKGYVMPLKDIRKQFANCDEALSSISDCIYDEVNAIHWHPAIDDSGGDPRAREQVKEVMDDVEEIKADPEEWAEQEEAEMDDEGPNEADAMAKLAGMRAAASKTVMPLKSLPPAVQQALAAVKGRTRRDVEILKATQVRPYQGEYSFFDLSTGNLIPTKFRMPEGWRGDEDYWVGHVEQPLPAGQGFIDKDTYWTKVYVNPSDFDAVAEQATPLVPISRQEYMALHGIYSTKASGRPNHFKVYDIGPYHKENPYIQSLIKKGLLTRGLRLTTSGNQWRQERPNPYHDPRLPDQPVPMPPGLEEKVKAEKRNRRRRWASAKRVAAMYLARRDSK
tara:strand:+ start:20395 stop:21687 length:1293 start_codon:yes stop_codon:yes gene_type:complete